MTSPTVPEAGPQPVERHNESCVTATALESGHHRCQCLCHDALERAANEGRNVLPDATDDQAAVIEQWAASVTPPSSPRRRILDELAKDADDLHISTDPCECGRPDCPNPGPQPVEGSRSRIVDDAAIASLGRAIHQVFRHGAHGSGRDHGDGDLANALLLEVEADGFELRKRNDD